VDFSTASPGLAGDVAALLLRLGIMARIRVVPQGEYRPMHLVSVRGGDAQRRFLDLVGGFGPRLEPAMELARAIAESPSNANVDTLPVEVFESVRERTQALGVSQRAMTKRRGTSYGGSSHFRFAPSRTALADYAALLEDASLLDAATSGLFWDRIIAIEPAGEEEVFDLTVPGPACWLADGIVSHNSGAIEQDADVVVFIHRPEVYGVAEKEGIAEIILGKQRNGPIGMMELSFQKTVTRFENLARVRE
jgi:replicative DNA helicase